MTLLQWARDPAARQGGYGGVDLGEHLHRGGCPPEIVAELRSILGVIATRAVDANDRRTFHAVIDALEAVGADTVTRTWLEEIRRTEWAQVVTTDIQAPHTPAFAIGRVIGEVT